MRGSVEYPVYKQVVLGSVFSKFVSDRFEKRRQELIAEGKKKHVEQKFAYTMKNVFYLPQEARWNYIATEGNPPYETGHIRAPVSRLIKIPSRNREVRSFHLDV